MAGPIDAMCSSEYVQKLIRSLHRRWSPWAGAFALPDNPTRRARTITRTRRADGVGSIEPAAVSMIFILHAGGATMSRGCGRLMLGLVLGMASLYVGAQSPPQPTQASAVNPVGAADAGTAMGPHNAVAQSTATAMSADQPKDDGIPTDQECRSPYPAGAKVKSVTRIAYRDIRAAQADDTSIDRIGAHWRSGRPPSATPDAAPTARQPGQRGSPAEKRLVEPEDAQLRHALMIEVVRLPALARLARCPADRQLVLFLAGRPMRGLTANPSTDPAHNSIIFELERTKENKEDWTFLLGRASFRPVPINVSVGFDDSYAIPSDETVEFRAIPLGWSIAWLGIMLVFALLIIWAGKHSGMFRDSGAVAAGQKAMFSLARIQLAFWTFIVLGSFILIGMITGDYLNSVNENVLALMGISIGTSLGSSVIDNGASGASARVAPPSTGVWWRDILSDGKDISVHRLQMAAWTIVLGIVFAHGVYSTLAMPNLPAELLALMGISAGTYLGLKVTLEPPPNIAPADGRSVADVAPDGSTQVDPAKPGQPLSTPPVTPAEPTTTPPPSGTG